MDLYEKLSTDYITAFKAKDMVRKEALSFVISQLKNKKIELQKELDDSEVISIVKKEIKARQEAIAYLEQAQKVDEKSHEEAIIAVLSVYVPHMMSYETLLTLVQDVVMNQWITDIQKSRGEIVKSVMADYKSVVDGKMLQDVINSMI